MKTIKQLIILLALGLALTSCSVQYRATTPMYYDPIYYPYYYQQYVNYWGNYYYNQPYYNRPYIYYQPNRQIINNRSNAVIRQRRPNTTNSNSSGNRRR